MTPRSFHHFRRATGLVALLLLAIPAAQSQEQTLVFDFGAADNQTAPPPIIWNNIPAEVGSTAFEFIDLVDTDGEATGVQLLIDQAFDATADENGTQSASEYPASATRDSLVAASGVATVVLVTDPPNTTETFTLTFYASDLSTAENRETLYEVIGATTQTATLNPSGNVDQVAQVSDISADSSFGELIIALSPGSSHSGANNTVYLGVLQVESSAGWTAYVDFGSAQFLTTVVTTGPTVHWNNMTGTVGTTDTNILSNIVATDGSGSSLALEMIARFTGVNESGTTISTLYPVTATQDSLFGNTELFGGLTNVFPSFKVTGMDPAAAYDVTLYASRVGTGGDNRETLYTLAGATTEETTLNPSENIDGEVTLLGIMPNGSGEITFGLTPGPNNNNGSHFTYLGVLKIDLPAQGLSYLFDFGGGITTDIEIPSQESWNNVVESVGLTDDGTVDRLISQEGVRTDVGLQMVARFNGVNRNGTTESTVFPATATSDSLFGNTGSFNGLENVFPEFKLTGLDPESSYDFTFFGSRTATDNRETRYTVTGATSGVADLNVASNVDETASANGIVPTASGEITVAINEGPNNNNGSLFTYLGVMQVTWERTFVPRILVDAGGTAFPTTSADDTNVWNNFQGSVGQTDTGMLPNLVTVNGAPTPFGIHMLARFNGVNEAGTTDPAPYPTSATRDSLFGNTEDWSGLADIFPSFMLTGLDPSVAYDVTFYGSRSATDNRETEYTVTGANEQIVALNVAGNVDASTTAVGINPTTAGTITVAIGPGPNNNNGNHFTYLGVLQLDWVGGLPVTEDVVMSDPSYDADSDSLTFTLTGQVGRTYTIQGTVDFQTWDDDQTVVLTSDSQTVTINTTEGTRFYRVTR